MAKLKPQPKDKDELQGVVAEAVKAAVDHVQTELAPNRKKAQDYFDGKVDLGEEEGRSVVVATKVRDTIRQIKPSLMRVFLSHERPVEFIPGGSEDVAGAEQATRWCKYHLARLGGYALTRDAFHDALLKRLGILKVVWEEAQKQRIYTFSGLTEDQLYLLAAEPEVDVIEHSEIEEVQTDPATGAQQLVKLHDLKIARTTKRGEVRVVPIPPEEFFFSAETTNLETTPCCGHTTEKTVGELVEMGFDWDEIEELGSFASGVEDSEAEKEARTGTSKRAEPKGDPSLRLVSLTEAYMAVDVDGTGIPVLHRFICAGTSYKLLSWEPWDDVPFAGFEIDPEPHTVPGRSIFDLVKNEQDAGTSMLRGILDNVHMVNNPRTAILENQVNLDDLLNPEIGGVVRERVANAIRPLDVPFVAGQTLPALQYLDDLTEQKTGVTRASTGLDPDALQSTTKAAVSATIGAAAGQVEVIARNLAEGGLSRLYKLMLRLMVKHARAPEMIRLNGSFVPVDPRVWNIEMDLQPNIGLGTGQAEEKAGALGMILGFQQGVLQQYGLTNGLVTLTNLRNTVADMLALAGYHNADRYIAPMDPTREAELIAQQQQQAQAAQGGAEDPNAAYLQAETMKAQTKAQVDMMKAQTQAQLATGRLQLEGQRMALQDDRERDRMAQDLALRTAELAMTTGQQLDTSGLQAVQAAPRGPDGNVQGGGA
jgi:hypothetical protein